MKIITNNYKKDNMTNAILNEDAVHRVTCEECNSIFEVNNSELKIGHLGLKYCKCPCCGEEIYEEDFGEIKLTADSVKFPQHYFYFGNGKDFTNEEIDKEVRRMIKSFNPYDDDDFYRHYSTGNLLITVTKCTEENEYHIVVCKNYYDSYVPID